MTPNTPKPKRPAEVLGLSPDDVGKRARFHMTTGIDMEGTIDSLQPDTNWPLILIRDHGTITYLVANHVAGYTLYPAKCHIDSPQQNALAGVLVKLGHNPDPKVHAADGCVVCELLARGRA
ncbi:hypothetical protein [Stomatohabitans albus]|uniref:hypothetical protein n=1 Tax=Stomatohabitans albus TaxID=3110766 RepID=UPI00300CBE6F